MMNALRHSRFCGTAGIVSVGLMGALAVNRGPEDRECSGFRGRAGHVR